MSQHADAVNIHLNVQLNSRINYLIWWGFLWCIRCHTFAFLWWGKWIKQSICLICGSLTFHVTIWALVWSHVAAFCLIMCVVIFSRNIKLWAIKLWYSNSLNGFHGCNVLCCFVSVLIRQHGETICMFQWTVEIETLF